MILSRCSRNVCFICLGFALKWTAALCADPILLSFDIREGKATETLKDAAFQGNVEILMSVGTLSEVITKPVRGQFLVQDALDRMLEDTPLVAVPVSGGVAFGIIYRHKKDTSGWAQENQTYSTEQETTMYSDRKAKPKKRSGLINGLLSFVLASVPQVIAQNESDDDDEIVELSPFEVDYSKDEGWRAGTTLIGSRANQELKNVPLSVDALTVEFMEDLGIHDLDEAAEFIAGMDVIQRDETQNDSATLSFRGLPIADTPREGTQTTRNFFIWYPRADNYNVERLDFNKGSNSLMFGNAGPGGLATVYTKQARFEDFGKISAEYGSHDSYRFMIDVNKKVTDNVALRFNAVDMTNKSYIDFTDDYLRGYDLAGTIKLSEDTRFRFEAEELKYRRIQGTSDIVIDVEAAETDGFADNRFTFTSDNALYDGASELYYPSDGAGGFLDPLPVVDNESGAGGNEASLAIGQSAQIYDSDGDPLMVVGAMPKEANARGPRNFFDRDISNYTVWFEQRFGDLDIELAWNRQQQFRHINASNPGTDLSLTGTDTFTGDNRFYIQGSNMGEKTFGNDTDTVRLTASYPIEWEGVTKQFLVGNVTYLDDVATSFRSRWHNLAAARDPVTGELDPTVNLEDNVDTRLRHRIYFEDPAADFDNTELWAGMFPENMPVVEGVLEPILLIETDANKPFVDKRYTRSASLSAAGEYFDGRIRSLVGIRKDEFKLKKYQLDDRIEDGDEDDPVDASLLLEFGEKAYYGQDPFAGMPDDAPEYYAYDADFDQSATTYSAGLIYELTDSVNVYVNQSTSFQWQATEDLFRVPILAEEGETREIGFKGELFDGLFSISGAYYEIDRDNVAYRMVNNVGAADQEMLFNPVVFDDVELDPSGNIIRVEYDDPDDDAPGFIEIARGINSESRKVRGSEFVEGWEFNVLMKRTKGFQARFALSGNDIVNAPLIEEYASQVAKAEAGWSDRLAGAQAIDSRITDENWDDEDAWQQIWIDRFVELDLMEPGLVGDDLEEAIDDLENADYSFEPPFYDAEDDFRDELADAQENVVAARSGLITGSRTRPLSASWVLDYKFSDEFILPDFRILLSGRYGDKYLMDINDDINWYGGSTHPVALGLRYKLDVGDNPLDIRLSFKNIYDFENKDDVKGFEGYVDEFTGEEVVVLRNIQQPTAEISFVYQF